MPGPDPDQLPDLYQVPYLDTLCVLDLDSLSDLDLDPSSDLDQDKKANGRDVVNLT